MSQPETCFLDDGVEQERLALQTILYDQLLPVSLLNGVGNEGEEEWPNDVEQVIVIAGNKLQIDDRVRRLGRDAIGIINMAGLFRRDENPYLRGIDLSAAGFGAANYSSPKSISSGISRALRAMDLGLRMAHSQNLIMRKPGRGVRLNPLVRFIDSSKRLESEGDFLPAVADIKERARVVVTEARKPKVVACPPQKKTIKPAIRPLSLAQPVEEKSPPSPPQTGNNSDNWWPKAACKGQPTDGFYPNRPKSAEEKAAKRICRNCVVREECLDEALKREEPFGIWGGLNAKERRDRLSNTHSITTTPRSV